MMRAAMEIINLDRILAVDNHFQVSLSGLRRLCTPLFFSLFFSFLLCCHLCLSPPFPFIQESFYGSFVHFIVCLLL